MARYVHTTAALLTLARDGIDAKLTAIKSYLESTGLGYRTPLVDREGYPLPDIDHARILTERQHAARLLNDRKRIDGIAEMLAKTGVTSPDGASLGDELERLRPFAILDEVFADSPAESAGLQNGDFLLRFGGATRAASVPAQVREGEPVVLTVLRVEQGRWGALDITVVPAKWDGAGLIGAHLQPYPE
jgi:26S proteasome non-ATPase regulatory subunit 9